MKNSLPKIFSLILTLFLFSTSPANSSSNKQIISVKFYLVDDLEMTKDGVLMTNWLTSEIINKSIIPEVNKIWSQANIEWQVVGIENIKSDPKGRQEAITGILNSSRDEKGIEKNREVRDLLALFPLKSEDKNLVNIYVVPFLGNTLQGITFPRHKRIVIAGWSNKFSHAKLPPQECLKVEDHDNFQRGSFSRTLSHEFGHILGLKHPEKSDPIIHRIMGGKVAGYELTEAERKMAWEKAGEFSANKD